MRGRAFPLLLLLFSGAFGACATAHKPDPATLARVKLSRELVAQGDWGRAFLMLDDIHRQHPEDPEVLTLRGIVYRERGLFADAETDLKAALASTPESAEAHAALGILYDVQMRTEAEAQHQEAVRLAPNNAAYLNNLGFSLFLRQKFKPAIAEYEKAARLVPLSRRVRTNLGFACAAAGDWRRAAREFSMGGSEAEAKNNLGFAYERHGNMGSAYDLYLESVRLDPTGGKARSNLVHAAAVLGRTVPAEALASPPASESAPAATPIGPAGVSGSDGALDATTPAAAAPAPAVPPAATISRTTTTETPVQREAKP